MKLHIENALAARRRKTKDSLSPENDVQPAHQGLKPDYTTWIGSYPILHNLSDGTGEVVGGATYPLGHSQGPTRSGVDLTKALGVFPKPRCEVEEDGRRVLRSKALPSNASTDYSNSTESRLTSNSGSKVAVGEATRSDQEESHQVSERHEAGNREGEETDEIKTSKVEDGEASEAYTPSAKRRRTQPDEVKAGPRKRIRLPTEKRKAQNRTNQRAFRARKDTYVSDLEVEHRHLKQLVESQKVELKAVKELVKTLQEAARHSRNDSSSSSESSISEQGYTHLLSDTPMLGGYTGRFAVDVPVSPWSIPYPQPFAGAFDAQGFLNDMVAKSPMPMSNVLVSGDPSLTEPDLAWAWSK